MSASEADALLKSDEFMTMTNISITGVMGMATFTNDMDQVKKEFDFLKSTFDQLKSLSSSNSDLQIISMGMSGDYPIAIEEGSNMIRVGSAIFGARVYS